MQRMQNVAKSEGHVGKVTAGRKALAGKVSILALWVHIKLCEQKICVHFGYSEASSISTNTLEAKSHFLSHETVLSFAIACLPHLSYSQLSNLFDENVRVEVASKVYPSIVLASSSCLPGDIAVSC